MSVLDCIEVVNFMKFTQTEIVGNRGGTRTPVPHSWRRYWLELFAWCVLD